jgi:hypothetical protein
MQIESESHIRPVRGAFKARARINSNSIESESQIKPVRGVFNERNFIKILQQRFVAVFEVRHLNLKLSQQKIASFLS